MSYTVHIKKEIHGQNEKIPPNFTVQTLVITNNCIQKGNKLLPITNVLFIEED